MNQRTLRYGPRRGGSGPAGPRVYSVSQVVRGANRCLEQNFPGLHVEGEVTNLRIVGSGHAYFTLKDDHASLPVAMWRSTLQRLRFRLRDGQKLHVVGRLGIYPAQGKFQMYADRAEEAGLGHLMRQFEELKAKLRTEGLFAPERKRELPLWPRRIGVVTSATGAAIHDVLKVTRRRCPSRILLSPALVQGDAAPASLRQAFVRLQQYPEIDVIIIGRGGGAAEDLWAFNDEQLARLIAECPIPVVSAVGHEVDVTICDLVADVRAATPSHAAELVAPDLAGWVEHLRESKRRLALATRRIVLDERSRFDLTGHRLAAAGRHLHTGPGRRLLALKERLYAQHPRRKLAGDRKRLGELQARLQARHPRQLLAAAQKQLTELHNRLNDHHPRHRVAEARARLHEHQAALQHLGQNLTLTSRQRLGQAVSALDALSPLAVLERGYALTTAKDGRAVRDAGEVRRGDTVEVRLHRGKLRAQVTEVVLAKPES